MPNADYWKKRFLQLEEAQNQKGKNCCKEIEQQYQASIRSIDKKINEWYGRLAANNDVTMQEAYKLLNANELKEFKWDVDQYIKYGRENGVNGRWMKELENASAKYHISRLEAMKMDLRQELESLLADQQKTIDKTMRNVYKDGYMHTAYEIQKGMHVGWNFSTPDKRKIDKVIKNPWAADGKNFSERIWGNGTKLVGELNQILTQNVILGESPQKAIDKLSKRMDVSKNAAGRLVMTEQAFFSSASQREAFKDLDVEEFEMVATLDSHTTTICRNMDGKHFKMSQWEIGVTAPPFHVYCRSTTVPYFDDEEELGIVGERAARNEDGAVYYVPGNMTYNEWEQAFVKGGAKDDMEQLSLPLEKMQNGLKDDIIKLSDDERGAIIRYKSFDSYVINEALRNTDDITKLSDEQQKFINLLDQALSKVPKYKGNLLRTVDFSSWSDAEEKTRGFVESFVVGKPKQISQYWSTTIREQDDNTSKIRIYIIGGKNGHDIRGIGLDEAEILYERNSEFFVLEKKFVDNQWNILLREV